MIDAVSSPLFEVFHFDEENFAKALQNHWISAKDISQHKRHFRVLYKYLESTLMVKTILVEMIHYSRSYSSDYAAEYSLGTYYHDKFCRRLHFFSSPINHFAALNNTSISLESLDDIWPGYQGFITVKPLPKAILGTVLLNPPKTNNSDCWALRSYSVHLLGKTQQLKTLAFQEQDGFTSACATIALWIAIHMLHALLRVAILTPSAINNRARLYSRGRSTTSNDIGLDLHQICGVIDSIGLYPLLRTYNQVKTKEVSNLNDTEAEVPSNNPVNVSSTSKNKDKKSIKRLIYAYLRMQLPILVGLKLPQRGQHLITILGFEEPEIKKEEARASQPIIHGDTITTFYAHDDQTGPFTKIHFLNDEGEVRIIRWESQENEKYASYIAKISNVIVPIPREIRIPIEDIYLQVNVVYEDVLYTMLNTQERDLMEWDVYLIQENDYKSNLLKQSSIYSSTQQRKLLTSFLPPYIWIARGYSEGIPFIEFVFDATSIPTGNKYCIQALFLNEKFKLYLKSILFPKNGDDGIVKQSMFNKLFEKYRSEHSNLWAQIIQLFKPTQKDNSSLYNSWKSLIAKGLDNEAFKILYSEMTALCEQNNLKEELEILIIISSDYRKLEKEKLRGLILNQEYGVRFNVILDKILELISSLEHLGLD